MNKGRFSLNTKNTKSSGQLKPENDSENVSKLRASNLNRPSKPPKSLSKTEVDYFQIRKPLNLYRIEELNELGRKTYFQRVFLLARNIEGIKLDDYRRNSYVKLSDLPQADFREYLQRHLDGIFAICEKRKSTADHLSGIFIVMGITHTFLMIEGAEDMLANFFAELDLVHDKIWASSRVFLVEDKIGETYFKCFYGRRSAAINMNEHFLPSTANDDKLMALQHLKIKEKLNKLVESLSTQLKEAKNLKEITAEPFYLPADPFNKLLPEIQSIDLVLSASKFYRTAKDFSQTYRVLQVHQDEDSFLWPIQNNYTPLEIFKRSEFDVNLTFGSGGKDEKNELQENCSHDMEELAQNT